MAKTDLYICILCGAPSGGDLNWHHYYCQECGLARHQKQTQARFLVMRAVKRGELVRQPCEVCGLPEPVDAHHDDYSKPLQVRWFCRRHHKEYHHREYEAALAEAHIKAAVREAIGTMQ